MTETNIGFTGNYRRRRAELGYPITSRLAQLLDGAEPQQ
jgi:hypothetical protein